VNCNQELCIELWV